MASKRGICPISFLWQGTGIGVFFMRLSIGLMVVLIFGLLLAPLLHSELVHEKIFFFILLGLWCAGKIICVLKKMWCPEEDSNLHEENFTST